MSGANKRFSSTFNRKCWVIILIKNNLLKPLKVSGMTKDKLNSIVHLKITQPPHPP